jgi:hypothetical protein
LFLLGIVIKWVLFELICVKSFPLGVIIWI